MRHKAKVLAVAVLLLATLGMVGQPAAAGDSKPKPPPPAVEVLIPQPGDVVGLDLDDTRCPVGKVLAVSGTFVKLSIWSWAGQQFDYRITAYRLDDIIEIQYAYAPGPSQGLDMTFLGNWQTACATGIPTP